ncbi:MAG: 2-phosphosulfolactate phosphatase [Bacteroidota bacterium]
MAESNQKFVHVCLTPSLIDEFDVSEAIVVVIDILRATTSICVAFGNGADHVIPVEHIEECMAYKKQGYLVAAERNGEQIQGFDFGNSPFSFMEPHIAGAKIAITTTNGTRALKAAQSRNAHEIVIGAFSNISLLTDWLIKMNQHVCLLCSGWRNNFTMEDTIFAGAVAYKLRNHFAPYQDSNLMAQTLFKSANKRKRYFFRNSSHFHRLVHLNLQEDVKYALRRDTHPVLPLLIGNELRNIAEMGTDFQQYKESMLEI